MSLEEKKAMLSVNHSSLSLRKQCILLGLSRSGLYYQQAVETEENLGLMRLLDEEYTRHPHKGVLSMTSYLNDFGYGVNAKRVRRLLRQMGLLAIYPKRNLSQSHPLHRKYPYLLKDLSIERPNQVWCSDLTYLRLKQGFVYLVAVMDWHSRYVLSWQLSNSMEASCCVEALTDALLQFGKPEIFNTDQGSQYTSLDFTGILSANGIQISMDSKGRAFDNIFIERLWRSIKYEEVYIKDYKDYQDIRHARENLKAYFEFYNFERHHQGLGNRKPAEVYFGKAYSVKEVESIKNELKKTRKVQDNICLKPDHFSALIH